VEGSDFLLISTEHVGRAADQWLHPWFRMALAPDDEWRRCGPMDVNQYRTVRHHGHGARQQSGSQYRFVKQCTDRTPLPGRCARTTSVGKPTRGSGVDPDASVNITPASVDLIPARSPPSPPAGDTSGVDVHLTDWEDVHLRDCMSFPPPSTSMPRQRTRLRRRER
jgi:hypothetical protein